MESEGKLGGLEDKEASIRAALDQLVREGKERGEDKLTAVVVGALQTLLTTLEDPKRRASLVHLDSSAQEVSVLFSLGDCTAPLRFLECVGYASTNEGFRLEDPEGAATHAAISCGLRALKSLTDNPQKQTKTLTERPSDVSIIADRIGALLQTDNPAPQEDRCVGALLGCMVGDALGAGVEGYPRTRIRDMFAKTNGRVLGYINAPHMGVRKLGLRFGMYTDDTQTTLALATSIVENQALVPRHAALRYYQFFCTKPQRGYPPTAQAVLKAVGEEGADYRKTGTVAFPDGSFANGGAMRISPVGLAFRNASQEQLKHAVRWAIISSHVHAQAIDAAYLQARSVALFTHMSEEERKNFDPHEYLVKMRKEATTLPMKKRIKTLIARLAELKSGKAIDDSGVLDEVSEDEFQIKAVDAMAVVLWAVARYWDDPANCIVNTIGFGGDTDTIAAMVGALMGAMHGTSWIPKLWYDNLENGEYGRDYCAAIARGLAALDLRTVKLDDEGPERM